MELKFKLSIFEGPLDLLLHLIRKNEVDIQNIPVSEITSQYLEYLEMMKKLDLDIAGDFIAMAATLLRIKSRMLLPKPPVSEEEDTYDDPRQELVDMIHEYQKYKEAADFLDARRLSRELLFEHGEIGIEKEFENTEELLVVDMLDLLKTFAQLIKKNKQKLVIERDDIKIEDRIEHIRKIIKQRNKIGFLELFDGTYSKRMLVATFLALLELIKIGEVIAVQTELFGEIEITKGI
ncbi:MAG: segregation/condensation protein A [Candidatus Hydrogenedentota bacterium]